MISIWVKTQNLTTLIEITTKYKNPLSQRLQSDTPPTSNRRVIHQCYSSRGRAVINLTIPRVLTMKPYNFRRSIKFEIHCPNL